MQNIDESRAEIFLRVGPLYFKRSELEENETGHKFLLCESIP
jgi:hypothetical protein